MGAAFGGGSSQTLFGSSGASTFLSKATTAAAIVFMLTSLTLAYVSGGKTVKSVVSEIPVPAAEQQQTQEPQKEGNAADTGAPAETPKADAGTKTE